MFLSVIFLLVITSVLADKTYQISPSSGLTILYPKTENFKENENITLDYHIFNSTGHLLNNNQTTCYAHVIDEQSTHIDTDELTNNGNPYDKKLEILYTRAKIGLYTINVWCNSSTQAGYVSNYYYVTKTGKNNPNENAFLGAIVGFGLFILILLLIAYKLDDSHKILRTLIVLITFYLILWIPKLMINYDVGIMDISLYENYLIFLKVFSFYLLGYFIWSIADYYGKTATAKQFFKDNFGKKGGR